MKWRFHPEAAEEFLQAAAHYAETGTSLGLAFIAAMEEAVGLLLEHPGLGQEVSEGIRRHLLRRFPFSVYYTLENEQLFILAVAHMKRRPEYWRERVD